MAETEVLISTWDNTGEGTRLTSATASTWGLHSTGEHFTKLPGVLWQKICYSLWLTYPLQRGDSSSIPVSRRKAAGLVWCLSTAPVAAYRFTNSHPNGSAEKNRIGVGQMLCPNVSQLLRHWLCNLANISFNTSCIFLYEGLIYVWIWTGVARSIWWNPNKSLICDSP